MGASLEPVHGIRAMAGAYAAGGTVGLVAETLLSTSSNPAVIASALVAIAIGALLAGAALVRPSERLLEVAIAGAAALVSVALAHTEEVAANATLYFLPVALAAYCLARRGLGLVLCVTAVGFAVALGAPSSGLAVLDRWLLVMGPLAIVAALVVLLRGRIDFLVAELERATVTDFLTGLLNRRGFESRLVAALAEHRRRDSPLGLLVIDIDHFKATNDRFGHAAGDAVLELVARTLAGTARQGDVVARIGGEEFAVLLPDTGAPLVRAAGERLRAAVRSATGGATTVSVGAGTTTSAEDDPGELMRRTDRALYAAKHDGRDRVVVAA